MENSTRIFDIVIVGGGPAGATAAHDLAVAGWDVALLDREGRIKPCGGAIPPRCVRDFAIPESQIVAKANAARMIAPSNKEVDMPINGGWVGMVDREHFDEFLRARAAEAGAVRFAGSYDHIEREEGAAPRVCFRGKGAEKSAPLQSISARMVIGADGANSQVAKQEIKGAALKKLVFAYHEIVQSPEADPDFDGSRCDIYYQGERSPDFYAWVFPHGSTTSIGTGSAHKGFSLRDSIRDLRADTGLDQVRTIRTEGAPIPLKPLKRWDNGRDVMLAGDAAGCVAPASGEGIYYAMLGGRMAAEAAIEFLKTSDAKAFQRKRKEYLAEHGKVFFILGLLQHFWYRSDKRREQFVNICRDEDVQRLTWEGYMNKRLVKANHMAHAKILMKDIAHLFRFVSPGQRGRASVVSSEGPAESQA